MTLADLETALDTHFGGNAANRRWRITTAPVARRQAITEFADVAEFYEVQGFELSGGEYKFLTNIIVLKIKGADNYILPQGHGLTIA